MSATSYYENIVLDAAYGDDSGSTMPSIYYVGLFTSAPDDGGGGDEVSPTGTGYARVAVANNSTNWPIATGGQKSNGTKIQFPMAISPWGNITHWGLFDDASDGNLLVYGEVAIVTSPDVGNAPYFAISTLVITCD